MRSFVLLLLAVSVCDSLFLRGLLSLTSTSTSLPPLPFCSEEEHNAFYQDLWKDFVDKDNQATCNSDSHLSVLMPLPESLIDLFPSDVASNPFTTDALLKHLTVFSHVVRSKGPIHEDQQLINDGEKIFVALNGGEVVVKRFEGDDGQVTLTANDISFSECSSESHSTPCISVYTLEGIIEVTQADVQFALLHPTRDQSKDLQEAEKDDDVIYFPSFELPMINEEMEKVLREELDANMFADMWKRILEHIDTTPLTVDEMIILVPTDKAMQSLVPSQFNPAVLSQLLLDPDVQRLVLGNHIILREREIPEEVIQKLPEYFQIVKINMAGRNVVFHREDTKGGGSVFKANSQKIEKFESSDSGIVFYSLTEKVLYPSPKFITTTIERLRGTVDFPLEIEQPKLTAGFELVDNDSPFKSGGSIPHLMTSFVPHLESTISFALRSVGAARMANAWIDVKALAQNNIAEAEDNPCLLPSETGPCKLNIGKFYYNADVKSCIGFTYGGCEGNENRFDTAFQCSEACQSDPVQKQSYRDSVCSLPKYLHELPTSKSLKETCTTESNIKYHFDKESNECVEFTYEGCQGTENVFDSMDECKNICVEKVPLGPDIDVRQQEPLPKSKEDICNLPPYVDTPIQQACRARFPKWHFDSETARCQPVFYNGCGATENLFDNQKMCLEACSHKSEPANLQIFAPTDVAMSDLLQESGVGSEIFKKAEPLGRQFLLSLLSFESCQDGVEEITTLNPAFKIKCQDYNNPELVLQNAFRGNSFNIHLTNEVMSITVDDLKNAQANFGDRIASFRNSPRGTVVGDHVDTAMLPTQNDLVKQELVEAGFETFSQQWDTLREESDSPRVAEVCRLPIDLGDQFADVAPSKRFFYNVETGFCFQSVYMGTGGNENNFETYDQCVEMCGKFGGRVVSVRVQDSSDEEATLGHVIMTQANPDSPVFIRGYLQGLTPGRHGFHIHQIGDVSDGCKAAGGHYNPHETTHGAPGDEVRHVGDLGNVEANEVGEVDIDLTDNKISLYSESGMGIIGRSLVIHEGEDDLGQGQDEGSLSTGNAGGRIGCGVIMEEEKVKKAQVDLQGANLKGVLDLEQEGPSAPVTIKGTIEGLEKGLHGFHVHQNGDLSDDCKAAGGHFNPYGNFHGGPTSPVRHVGDLGNVITLKGPKTDVSITDFAINLYPVRSNIMNRAIVVHQDRDDFGETDHPDSLITGNAGGRVACGIIQETQPQFVAFVRIRGVDGVEGDLTLRQNGVDGMVQIKGRISGLTPGKHGFHVHENGETGDGCKAAGGHYNPLMFKHSSPASSQRHVGDLGNVISSEGIAEIDIEDQFISINGEHSIVGRTIVIHEGEDDLGNGGDEESLNTGNAGARVACGVIQMGEEQKETRVAHVSSEEHEVIVKQIGQKGFVEVVGELTQLSDGHYQVKIGDAECNSEDDQNDVIGEFEVIGSENKMNVFASDITLFGEDMILGRNLEISGPQGTVMCGRIEQTEDEFPQICTEKSSFSLDCSPSEEIAVWKYDVNSGTCARKFSDNCETSRNAFRTESECRIQCPSPGQQSLIILVTPELQEENPDKETVLSHLIRAEFTPGTEMIAVTLSGRPVRITDEDGELTVNGVNVHNVVQESNFVLMIMSESPFEPVIEEETADLLCTKTSDETLRIPVQDKALREGAEKLDVTEIFSIWDRMLEKEVVVEDEKILNQTIITGDDFSFLRLIPQDIANPFVTSTDLQKLVMSTQIVLDWKIHPNDAMIGEEGGLTAHTIGGVELVFKKEDDSLKINNVPVKAIQTSTNGVLYVTETLINISYEQIQAALQQ